MHSGEQDKPESMEEEMHKKNAISSFFFCEFILVYIIGEF